MSASQPDPTQSSIYNAPTPKPTPIVIGNRKWFHLRFDHRTDDEPERVVGWLKTTRAKDILVVSEVSDVVGKTHYHCLLDETRALATVREQFQTKFNFNGKLNEYSFVPATGVDNDLGTVERYLCKGTERGSYTVLYKCGKWDDELVALRNIQYWEVNEQVRLSSQMKPLGPIGQYFESNGTVGGTTRVIVHEIESKKRKSRSFLADVVDRLKKDVEHMTENHVVFDGSSNVLEANRLNEFVWFSPRQVKSHAKHVVTTLLKMHGENFKPYGYTQIENEYNAIVQALAPEYQTKSMIENLMLRNIIPL